MVEPPLSPAVPPGRWAVGVSGGADSVALLLLLHGRPGVDLHVAHLDHQTRAGESGADAAFVADLAGRLALPATVARRSDVEHGGAAPANVPARYRRARLAVFRRVVADHGLAGVVLAHHAGDQAETVLIRLLRGGSAASLAGMAPRATLGGLMVLRPLMAATPAALRRYLAGRGQPWREDATNATPVSLRNRVRPTVAGDPDLSAALVALAAAGRGVRDWLDARSQPLDDTFAVADLARLPGPVARHAAGRWLAARGVPADAVNRPTCDRLVAMAVDRSTPARQTFPGRVDVRRRGPTITVTARSTGRA